MGGLLGFAFIALYIEHRNAFWAGPVGIKGQEGKSGSIFFKGTVHLFHINCIKMNLISYINKYV